MVDLKSKNKSRNAECKTLVLRRGEQIVDLTSSNDQNMLEEYLNHENIRLFEQIIANNIMLITIILNNFTIIMNNL
jgi:hypothetical protein